MRGRRACLLAVALVLAGLAPGHGHAAQSGRSPEGYGSIEGGVTHEDRLAMLAARSEFRLWVLTAARGSGAWLADVEVTVRDAQGKVLHHGRIDGPWLMLELPPATYRVDAALEPGGTGRQTRVVQVPATGLRQVVFYFDTGDGVADEGREPWNPGAAGVDAGRPGGPGVRGKTPTPRRSGSIEP